MDHGLAMVFELLQSLGCTVLGNQIAMGTNGKWGGALVFCLGGMGRGSAGRFWGPVLEEAVRREWIDEKAEERGLAQLAERWKVLQDKEEASELLSTEKTAEKPQSASKGPGQPSAPYYIPSTSQKVGPLKSPAVSKRTPLNSSMTTPKPDSILKQTPSQAAATDAPSVQSVPGNLRSLSSDSAKVSKGPSDSKSLTATSDANDFVGRARKQALPTPKEISMAGEGRRPIATSPQRAENCSKLPAASQLESRIRGPKKLPLAARINVSTPEALQKKHIPNQLESRITRGPDKLPLAARMSPSSLPNQIKYISDRAPKSSLPLEARLSFGGALSLQDRLEGKKSHMNTPRSLASRLVPSGTGISAHSRKPKEEGGAAKSESSAPLWRRMSTTEDTGLKSSFGREPVHREKIDADTKGRTRTSRPVRETSLPPSKRIKASSKSHNVRDTLNAPISIPRAQSGAIVSRSSEPRESRIADLKPQIIPASRTGRARATDYFEGNEVPKEDCERGRLKYETRSKKVDLTELEGCHRGCEM